MRRIAKLISAVIVLALILALPAAADSSEAKGKFDSVIILTSGDKAPNVTLEYEITTDGCISEPERDGVDRKTAYTATKDGATEPFTVGTAEFRDTDTPVTAGGVKKVTKQVEIDFTGTKFLVPGVYRYYITEKADRKVAGLTLGDTKIICDVYVWANGSEGAYVYNLVLHTADSTGTFDDLSEDKKVDGFSATYSAYDLTVSKTVSGNQSSKDKYFKVTVKLALPAGTTAPYDCPVDVEETNPAKTSTTVYSDMTNPTIITALQLQNGDTVTFYLKHGQSLKVNDLPAGTTYEVAEAAEDYASTATGDTQGSMTADKTVDFDNHRGGEIPTGLTLGAIPGVILLVSGLSGTAFVAHRKKSER